MQEMWLGLGCPWKGHMAVRARAGSAQRCWKQGTCPQTGAVPQFPGVSIPSPALLSPGEKPHFQRQPGGDAALPSPGSSQPEA